MSQFRRDVRGNIAVIFAIALVPIITTIGCAIDYSMAALSAPAMPVRVAQLESWLKPGEAPGMYWAS